MCYKALQGGRGGVKNYPKKCYIIFEWPLDLGIEHVTLMSKYSIYIKKILNSSRNVYIDGEIIKSTNYSLKYAHCFSGNKLVQKYGGWDPRI